MPTKRTSVRVDVCPEATPRDSWGGGASVSALPSPRQGAGPGGGSHIRGCRQEGLHLGRPRAHLGTVGGGDVHRELLTRGPRATPGPLSNGIKNPTCMCDLAMEKSHSFHQIFEEVPFSFVPEKQINLDGKTRRW